MRGETDSKNYTLARKALEVLIQKCREGDLSTYSKLLSNMKVVNHVKEYIGSDEKVDIGSTLFWIADGDEESNFPNRKNHGALKLIYQYVVSPNASAVFRQAVLNNTLNNADLILANKLIDSLTEKKQEIGVKPLFARTLYFGSVQRAYFMIKKFNINLNEQAVEDYPLHIVTRFIRPGFVYMLLANGADPNVLDKKKNTPLHLVTMSPMEVAISDSIILLLLMHGAKVNAQNDRGETPLHTAALTNNASCAKVLLKYGADSSIKDKNGFTPKEINHSEYNSANSKRVAAIIEKFEKCVAKAL